MRRARLRLPQIAYTSSFRLTLLYAGLLGISALVLFGAIYWYSWGSIASQLDTAVTTELAEEQADAGTGGEAALQRVVAAQAAHDSGAYYLLQDKSGRVLAGNLPAMTPVVGFREWQTGPGRGIRGRGIVLPGGAYLFTGLNDTDLRAMDAAVARIVFWVLGSTIVLALAGGALMSFSALRRVELVSRASRQIVAGDLSQRIPVRGTDDEFDHLAVSLNEMLDRIQSLMEGMRQVSSDIAHDLRTPLSRHRQRLELALMHGGTAAELRSALEESVRDVDGILETFGALLSIARLGARTDAADLAPVDLGALLENLTEAYRAVAEDQEQHLACHVDGGLPVTGGRELLTQLFVNLIENALRHTPPGASITVSAHREGDAVVAQVYDSGPGIPADSRAHVFRPFFRLEASRTTPGTGLGLSLVAAIAELHSARIALLDNQPGLRVRLTFPGSERSRELHVERYRWPYRALRLRLARMGPGSARSASSSSRFSFWCKKTPSAIRTATASTPSAMPTGPTSRSMAVPRK